VAEGASRWTRVAAGPYHPGSTRAGRSVPPRAGHARHSRRTPATARPPTIGA
jgi:hypothetical protein